LGFPGLDGIEGVTGPTVQASEAERGKPSTRDAIGPRLFECLQNSESVGVQKAAETVNLAAAYLLVELLHREGATHRAVELLTSQPAVKYQHCHLAPEAEGLAGQCGARGRGRSRWNA